MRRRDGRVVPNCICPALRNEPLTVYVPTSELSYIREKSAIVGRPFIHSQEDLVEICFEGNLHGTHGLAQFSERVRHAAGRLVSEYPTVARAVVLASKLVPVGTYIPRTHDLQITNPEALAGWVKSA